MSLLQTVEDGGRRRCDESFDVARRSKKIGVNMMMRPKTNNDLKAQSAFDASSEKYQSSPPSFATTFFLLMWHANSNNFFLTITQQLADPSLPSNSSSTNNDSKLLTLCYSCCQNLQPHSFIVADWAIVRLLLASFSPTISAFCALGHLPLSHKISANDKRKH